MHMVSVRRVKATARAPSAPLHGPPHATPSRPEAARMSARSLPVSSPGEQGVDASGVHAFLDAVEAAPDIEPHSLMILRHGHVVASGWWAPYTPMASSCSTR